MWTGMLTTRELKNRSVLTIREFIRFVRILPRRIPGKVRSLLRAASGTPAPGFPPDDFDQRTGLDTAGVVKIYKLDSVSANYVHAQGYQPINPKAFGDALKEVSVGFGGYTFVDIGCGKGRALFLASDFSFRRIIGVEISPSLVRAALQNLAKWKGRQNIEIICTDACEWEWPQDNLVIFLYNPFDKVVLSRVLENLHRSLAIAPRDIWLIYCSPAHKRCVESQKWLQRMQSIGPSVIYRRQLQEGEAS
jgi:SAM-dependent methyltransferase